eukprot:CAMPEP_0118817526 /NCGR_PEP_ID=MMETSP1162-20130426/5457_1 /TAXON_ID=33656 /ORGANISM="Phaeocystis Sp, Strain CCMP2710" /LENGTH=53 /DNA_ID=CAMNT_0006747631 /DNA_START=62 /DNA_END=220 /DNA_ORIENTATION=+
MERTWSGARVSSDASRPLAGGASSALLARPPAYGPASLSGLASTVPASPLANE